MKRYKKLIEFIVRQVLLEIMRNKRKISEDTTTASMDAYSTPFWGSSGEHSSKAVSILKKQGYKVVGTAKKEKNKK